MPAADGEEIMSNYGQLRRIEGDLRRWSFEGETLLPDEPAPFQRVAVRCGFATAAEFAKAVAEIREKIRAVYLRHFRPRLESQKRTVKLIDRK